MSLSNASETDLLKLLFNNTTWANVGDATGLVGSGAAGSLYISLHTADPGEAGDQTTNEVATANWTGYARQAVPRSSAGFTVSGNTVSNAALVVFTAGDADDSTTVTHFAIGRASTGAGEILVSAALTSSLAVTFGVKPVFAIGGLSATAD